MPSSRAVRSSAVDPAAGTVTPGVEGRARAVGHLTGARPHPPVVVEAHHQLPAEHRDPVDVLLEAHGHATVDGAHRAGRHELGRGVADPERSGVTLDVGLGGLLGIACVRAAQRCRTPGEGRSGRCGIGGCRCRGARVGRGDERPAEQQRQCGRRPAARRRERPSAAMVAFHGPDRPARRSVAPGTRPGNGA
jgi:hypothetical protein